MPLNWGNTLYPDTRLSNHLDFLSLSFSSCGKQNIWHTSPDNTEAHYLLHACYKAALKQGKFTEASLADQVLGIK